MRHTCTKVTLRQRVYDSGRISLYLDYYPAVRHPETMQMTRREYLGIYLYAHPKNELQRSFNYAKAFVNIYSMLRNLNEMVKYQ